MQRNSNYSLTMTFFGRLYSQTISKQSKQRMERNLDNEKSNHQTKGKQTLSFFSENGGQIGKRSVCVSMWVYGGW